MEPPSSPQADSERLPLANVVSLDEARVRVLRLCQSEALTRGTARKTATAGQILDYLVAFPVLLSKKYAFLWKSDCQVKFPMTMVLWWDMDNRFLDRLCSLYDQYTAMQRVLGDCVQLLKLNSRSLTDQTAIWIFAKCKDLLDAATEESCTDLHSQLATFEMALLANRDRVRVTLTDCLCPSLLSLDLIQAMKLALPHSNDNVAECSLQSLVDSPHGPNVMHWALCRCPKVVHSLKFHGAEKFEHSWAQLIQQVLPQLEHFEFSSSYWTKQGMADFLRILAQSSTLLHLTIAFPVQWLGNCRTARQAVELFLRQRQPQLRIIELGDWTTREPGRIRAHMADEQRRIRALMADEQLARGIIPGRRRAHMADARAIPVPVREWAHRMTDGDIRDNEACLETILAGLTANKSGGAILHKLCLNDWKHVGCHVLGELGGVVTCLILNRINLVNSPSSTRHPSTAEKISELDMWNNLEALGCFDHLHVTAGYHHYIEHQVPASAMPSVAGSLASIDIETNRLERCTDFTAALTSMLALETLLSLTIRESRESGFPRDRTIKFDVVPICEALKENQSLQSLHLTGLCFCLPSSSERDDVPTVPSLLLDVVDTTNTTLQSLVANDATHIFASDEVPFLENNKFKDYLCATRINYACTLNKFGRKRLRGSTLAKEDLINLLLNVQNASWEPQNTVGVSASLTLKCQSKNENRSVIGTNLLTSVLYGLFHESPDVVPV